MADTVIRPNFGFSREMGPSAPLDATGEVLAVDPLARLNCLRFAEVVSDLVKLLRHGTTFQRDAISYWQAHIEVIEVQLVNAGYRDDEARRRVIALHTAQVRAALDRRLPAARRATEAARKRGASA